MQNASERRTASKPTAQAPAPVRDIRRSGAFYTWPFLAPMFPAESMSAAHQSGKRSAARLGREAQAFSAPHGNHGDNKSWSTK